MKKIRDIMDEEPKYSGGVEVVQFLEVLRELGWSKISDRVVTPLKGLKVAPYYGCLLLRPRGFGIDDPDNPLVMESLFKTLGAEVVDIPFKSKCCGAYHTVHMKEVVADLSQRILTQAFDGGSDLVATACPLCEFNLGSRQKEIKNSFRGFKQIPVVYYTQLMTLAFGLGEEASAFGQNDPDPRPILKERGLL
jgi:heterodisulfide reductase subunit B